jgi:hypothetical protein
MGIRLVGVTLSNFDAPANTDAGQLDLALGALGAS